MFVPFYAILKQMLNIFWSSTPINFSYEPPLSQPFLLSALEGGECLVSRSGLDAGKQTWYPLDRLGEPTAAQVTVKGK
jgi:hypothetical protein